ncbi:MAG: hypothetical protein JO256_09365 [Alphaproteobacteria bacterium]|nr:hypothetical protein [Alphaproteobacteria bacterium]
MGDASKRVTQLRLAGWAWLSLGAAFFWPLLAIVFLGGAGPWPAAFWLDLAPSLAMVALAGLLFLRARR